MQSSVSIPIFVEERVDLEGEQDPRNAKTASTRKSGSGFAAAFRLFTLSVLLGMTLGSAACVLEPEQSMKVSLTTRAFLKSCGARASAAIHELRHR